MTITKEQLKANMEKFVNKDCLIKGDHPWSGERGRTDKVEYFNGKPGMVVQLDNGTECVVYDSDNIMFLS